MLSMANCVFSLKYVNTSTSEVLYEKGISAAITVFIESNTTMPSYVYSYIAYIRERSNATYQGLKFDSLVDLCVKTGAARNEQEAIEYLASQGLTKVTKEEFEEFK